MSKYTIELRKVCDILGRETVESWFKNYELSNYLTQTQIETIEKTNTWNKDNLARKIVDYYYMREIGFETIELFKHYVLITMETIMERKLPIIYTNCVEYDPFESVDFHITETRKIKGNSETTGKSTSNSNNNSSGLNISSDTPQGNINKQDILNGNYASSANASETNSSIDDETNTNSKGSSDTEEIFEHQENGNKGVLDSYQKMILQLRETFVAVDEDIIKELNKLFMGLY